MPMWFSPISIWEKGHLKRTVNSVESAARCLTETWPGDQQLSSYTDACKVCLTVLEGNGFIDDARDAFLAAAIDADILA